MSASSFGGSRGSTQMNPGMALLNSRKSSYRSSSGNQGFNRSSGLISLVRNTTEKKETGSKKKLENESSGLTIIDGTISGIYSSDVNILEIDKFISSKIKSGDESESVCLQKKIKDELVSISGPQNIVDRKNSVANIKSCREKLEKIARSEKLNEYIEESEPVLKAYNEIGVKREKIVFGRRQETKKNHRLSDSDEYRISLIEKYLHIANKYVCLNIFRQHTNCCINCKSDFSLTQMNDEGIIVCSVCGIETITMISGFNYDDDTNNIAYRPEPAGQPDRINFMKALEKYQGKQTNNFGPDLFDKLDAYFMSINMEIGSVISKYPLITNPKSSTKRRGDTTRDIMMNALKSIGFSCYGDINLICKLYWKWELPDISHLETQIMEDYDISQEIFERIKGDRKSCLNIQYRLWKHLTRIGHPCSPSDFKLIKTSATIDYYENIWENICRELKWDKGASLS